MNINENLISKKIPWKTNGKIPLSNLTRKTKEDLPESASFSRNAIVNYSEILESNSESQKPLNSKNFHSFIVEQVC
jgi:hypothetical protein